VVQRVITDLCVLDITQAGFEIIELASGVKRQEVEKLTDAPVCFIGSLI